MAVVNDKCFFSIPCCELYQWPVSTNTLNSKTYFKHGKYQIIIFNKLLIQRIEIKDNPYQKTNKNKPHLNLNVSMKITNIIKVVTGLKFVSSFKIFPDTVPVCCYDYKAVMQCGE